MRLVTILIIFTLAAAAYVANFAAKDHESTSGNTAELASNPGGEDAAAQYADSDRGPGDSGSASLDSGGMSGANGSGSVGAGELPAEFPSELTMRSGASDRPMGGAQTEQGMSADSPSQGEAATSATAGPSTPQRRRVAPVLRQPNAEENAERERMLAERFGEAAEPAAAGTAAGQLTGAQEEVKTITLPQRKPARERSVQVAEIEEEVKQPERQITALDQEVAAAAAALAAATTTRSTVSEPSQPASTNLATSGEALLRARVIDSTGQPLPTIGVTLIQDATGRAVKRLMSDANGVLVADAVPDGRYRLQVEKDSVPEGVSSPVRMQQCRSGKEPAGYGSVCVTLDKNGPTAMAEIVLPLSSGVQGTILGRTGAPVKGVLIRAVSLVPGFGGERAIAETDVDGFFFFALVPGPYKLQMLLPGNGRPEELTRSMDVDAKPGSALLLDEVDFSKRQLDRQSMTTTPKVTIPAVRSEPAAPAAREVASLSLPAATKRQVVEAAAVAARTPEPVLRVQSKPAALEEEEFGRTPGRVELRGRVISKWGESVPALSVVAESLEGRVLEATQTSDNGQYILEDVPIGTVVVRVASDLKVNREGRYGTTLLKRPEPTRVQTFTGQKRVSLKDVVVDVRRIYRLSGRIKVQPEAIAEFKASLGPTKRGQAELTEPQLLRAYYRGLRLTQKNRGAQGDSKDPLTALGQAIKIQYDGSFVWTCPLPAEDILLVLEPRSSRKSTGYGGPIGIPVTPAGVRPAELEIVYPPVLGDSDLAQVGEVFIAAQTAE